MTRTELIARLRDSPWHLLRTEYSDIANMLEADAVNDDLTIAYMSGFKAGEDKYKAAARLAQQPLTEQEVDAIENKVYMTTTNKGKPKYEYALALVRAIEAAHGITGETK